ncbi:MAG: hypothetical protein R3B84_13785 [Zavarzinella sp.]
MPQILQKYWHVITCTQKKARINRFVGIEFIFTPFWWWGNHISYINRGIYMKAGCAVHGNT